MRKIKVIHLFAYTALNAGDFLIGPATKKRFCKIIKKIKMILFLQILILEKT